MARFFLSLIVAGALTPALWAQTKGTLAGKVTDTTGALLKQVRLTVKNVETGVVRRAQSGEEGAYVVPELPVGNYELRVELAGFRPVTRKGVRVVVGETAMVDFEMQVGAIDQEITVTAEAAPINTSTSELSYLVGERAVRELPLNGRNFVDLSFLQPGVVAYPHRDGGSVVAHGVGVSINGQDPRSNVYLLDGTPMNDLTNGTVGSAASTSLGVETIREFRIETNAYSAEFGRNSGGQVSVITKSGSNELHGSVYEFFRNNNFDARNFFDPQRIPRFTRNQFGGSLGGPVRQNRTFFFLGVEALRERLGRTITSFTPSAELRRGVVAPEIRPFLDEMPLPNGNVRSADGLGDFTFNFNQIIRQQYVQGRIDQNLTSNQQLFVRYTFDDASQRLPTDFPQFPRTFRSRNQYTTAEHRWVLSPRTLNTFRASYARTRIGQIVEATTSRPLPTFIAGREFPGSIDIGGMPRFGTQSSANLRVVQNVFSFEDGLTLVRGKHSLKAGVLAERYQANLFNPTFSLGIYTFNNVSDFLRNLPFRFIGLPSQGALDRYWRATLLGFYVQDDYRITPRLTLNLGARYEFSTLPRENYGRDSALLNIFTDRAPQTGQLYQNPTYRNFSPRVGFAWDVLGNGKMSVRGGYGIFFNTANQQHWIVTITNPPFTPRIIVSRAQGVTFPNPPLERGSGNSIRPVEYTIKSPYTQTWNLSVQRELPWGMVATLGYAGSRGVHLWRNSDVNTAVPTLRPDGSYFFPAGAPRQNTAFTTIELKKSDGNSWYNAGIFELRKRFQKGLTFQTSYTFARNIDTTQGSVFFSDANNGTTSAMPEYPGFQYNKGLADYHAKHNWVTNFTYELPLPKRILTSGWQIAGIASARSGAPLTVFVQGNWSRSLWGPSIASGVGFDRPSFAPGRTHESAILGTPDRWLDPTAFILPTQGTLGNVGRGALIGPNLRTFDFSLTKNTRVKWLGEAGNLQFRAEAFNLFNRANFGIPALIAFAGNSATEAPNSTFGRVRNTITSARQIQLALRLVF